jgi:hypothetical protein
MQLQNSRNENFAFSGHYNGEKSIKVFKKEDIVDVIHFREKKILLGTW